MSKSPEDKIEEKLRQLEIAMREDTGSNVPAPLEKSTSLSSTSTSKSNEIGSKKLKLSKEQESQSLKADLTLLTGSGFFLAGIFLLFSNLRVSGWSGWGGGWGSYLGSGNGQGILVLLLIIGLGFFFYDYKNKIGWGLIVGSLAAIIFSVFLSLHIYLQSMSLFGFLFIVIPLAIGGGLIAKAMKKHKEIEQDSKED